MQPPPPPPTPPTPAFSKSRKLASEHTHRFESSHASIVFANGRVQLASSCFRSHGRFETSDASIVFASGEGEGGAAPPLSLRLLESICIDSKPLMRALCLHMGGGGAGLPSPPQEL